MIDILKETMGHFEPKKEENKQDEWAGFRSYNVGGMQVIDLESVDEGWSAYESVDRNSIERRALYGEDSSNPNRM